MYSKQIEKELVQLFEHDNLNLSILRVEESEHGLNKVIVYKTELIDNGERGIFKSNDSNIERAFHIYDTIHKAVLLGRCHC